MKLRIRGNSLRLRLTRAEVDGLAKDGRVEDAIAFGPGPAERLVYAVVLGATDTVTAAWSAGVITVVLPEGVARDWAASERVGIEHDQVLGAAGALRIVVEKDFACLAPREGEGDEEAFPNPNASTRTC
jgi:hypothetical protein